MPQAQGDADGRVAWRVEVELSSDPAFADEPYAPAPYDATPARGEAGWYAGDLHVHAEHSALGDATMRETLDYAFGEREARLRDALGLRDLVGLGRDRAPPGLLPRQARRAVVGGHHLPRPHEQPRSAPLRRLPHRPGARAGRATGRWSSGAGRARRRELFGAVRGAGGFTQVNHPTIFPSEVPAFAGLCRGCPWDYSDAETDWSLVDAYEVHTGPPGNDGGPNPFTLTAIDEYDRLRRLGHWVAAVAVSDSHNAGRTKNPVTQAPVGTGTTVVYAPSCPRRGSGPASSAGTRT